MNWGVRLGYESITVEGTTDLDQESSGFDLSVNGDLGGANVWFTYVAGADALASGGTDVEADMTIGLTYGYSDHTLFAEYSSEGGNDTTDNESENTNT